MKGDISVSNGSDCPVELPDVMAGLQCAVTRKSLKKDAKVYLPEEAFSMKEALDSYTIRSAEGAFEENRKGKIQSGYLADFVILDENPFEVNMEIIKDIKINATYLGGKKVY